MRNVNCSVCGKSIEGLRCDELVDHETEKGCMAHVSCAPKTKHCQECGGKKEKVLHFGGYLWECLACRPVKVEFKKDDQGKAPLEYLGQFYGPLSDVCRVAKFGGDKYGWMNWAGCGDVRRYQAALMRHALAAMNGEKADPDHGISHYAAVAWNALVLLHFAQQEAKESPDA